MIHDHKSKSHFPLWQKPVSHIFMETGLEMHYVLFLLGSIHLIYIVTLMTHELLFKILHIMKETVPIEASLLSEALLCKGFFPIIMERAHK